jgi:predicted nucleic acid-binding protein
MYLLDTNVISELRKERRPGIGPAKIDRRVQAWASSAVPQSLFLSVISIVELEIGLHLLERRDPSQAVLLASWIRHRVLDSFAGRILSVDLPVAERCATLHVPDPVEDRDSLIAATALVHGMTVVTRNVAHFKRTGVEILNPWDG